MRLTLSEMPDHSALIASVAIAMNSNGKTAAEREQEARKALRFHLARLKKTSMIALTQNENGDLLAFVRCRPETEDEWLKSVAAVLNEAEILSGLMKGAAASSSVNSLFGGFKITYP
jgi:hypothetical protein